MGPYRVEISTDPATIPVGKAKLLLKVTDAAGKPVEGAQIRTLTKMPGMNMGEREETATPQPGQPGVYNARAAFPMGGGYTSDIKISGPQGEGTGSIPLQTGQNTGGGSGGSSLMGLLPWIVGLALVGFVLYRMRRTGQHINWRGMLQPRTLAGIGVLVLMLAGVVYAVNNLRRPGSMTPLEAQGMEMSMPAPEGISAVELATVQRGAVRSTVRYTGQAVGYVEQDVYPRVTGTLEWMPFYAGDRVKRGQLLARLDVSQVAPQVAQQRAAAAQTAQGTSVARIEYQQALGAVNQAEAELGQKVAAVSEARSDERKARAEVNARRGAVAEARSGEQKARAEAANKRGGVQQALGQQRKARASLPEAQSALKAARGALAEAQSDLAAAQEEQSGAESEAVAAGTQIADAQAQLQAALADQEYWQKQLARTAALLKAGAVSGEEFQREKAQAENADAKVLQARARVKQVQATVRGAQSRTRRAGALIRSAQAKAQQAEATIAGNQSRIEQARADIFTSEARIEQARAEVSGAGADIGGAAARIQQMEENVRGAQQEVGAAQARIRQAAAELEAHHANVRQMRAAANASRQRIGQAQSAAQGAQAGVSGAAATLSYAQIRSQTDGVVTQRIISPGTLVSPGQAILRVSQISPIRLQANVAEGDLKRIRVGSQVTVRERDNQGGKVKSLMARVTSIAPAVDPQTRTGLVEVIVPNTDRSFLPGEYVVMEIETGQSIGALQVPSVAIQQRTSASGEVISTQPTSYIWMAEPVAGQQGQFTVKQVEVRTGVSNGSTTEILSGLQAGQRVVTAGYQYLKEGAIVATEQTIMASEGTRSGGMEGMPGMEGSSSPDGTGGTDGAADDQAQGGGMGDMPGMTQNGAGSANTGGAGGAQAASIAVTEQGFEPQSVTLKAGTPARVTFTRKTDATCAKEVVFPDFNIKKALPLNEPVTVEFTPKETGTLSYACGMNMLKGQVVVQ
ncbi:MAG TPA: efflux RND transporter periplasmic adaptor subunit [Chloroflexota bacterium]|nr:efflux RND transporter periplasmic adaptor subunit [Chloroflexota bacterium]